MKKLLLTHWKSNLAVILLMICAGGSLAVTNFMNAAIINSLIQSDYKSFQVYVLKLIVFYGLFLLFTFFRIKKVSSTVQKMSTYLRTSTSKKILTSEYQKFHKQSVGNYASWLTNDVTQIEQLCFSPFYELLSGIISSIIAVISLLTFHWILVLVTFIEVFILLQLPKIFQKNIAQKTEEVARQNEFFLEKITDYLSGFNTIFAFQKQPFILNKISEASKNLGDSKNSQTNVMAKVAVTGGIGNVFGQVSIFALTGLLALAQQVSVGAISATGSFASEIFNTMGNISQSIASINSAKPLFEKFDSIEGNDIMLEEQPTTPSTINCGFSLKRLSYQYDNNNTVLSNLDYQFELNKKYAIVGKSGTGKSTLLDILSGKLKNYAGSVTLGNREIKNWNYNQLFQNIVYLDQRPHIFNTTIRENLDLGEGFPEESLWNALEKADLKDLVKSLPHQLDAQLGEGGASLSGGQAQRIALARGFLRERKIILVDEGTSSLDKETAIVVENNLLKNRNTTVIMITHHLSKEIENNFDSIFSIG